MLILGTGLQRTDAAGENWSRETYCTTVDRSTFTTANKHNHQFNWITEYTSNKKYVLSNSESVQYNFFILITWRSPVQKLLLCTKFHENRMIFHWDMAIYRFLKWRPSAILELFYHHTRLSTKSLLLAASPSQISCQSDTQIWRYNYLNFSHIWLEMPIQAPKMGVLRTLNP